MKDVTHPQVGVEPNPGLPDTAMILLEGRLTRDEVPDVHGALLHAVEETDRGRVVLELSEVEAMDTAGAALLVEAFRAARTRNRSILLCSPSDSVLKIFRLAGFDDVLARCCHDASEVERRLMG